ncbi:hypothetical protein CPB83DRAFT_910921 [Crepidotus variabilis]|uniref:DUF6534 domain-containing protein n=1 Tax=Crepidotus variabilis TaxID=179855 RepID=A0A9P6E648_9AGAR|nr:hypothetical protein CPB83DRAFT_910921 [Crepidotus variabilis]
MERSLDIPKTFGALLLGGLFASFVSGFVTIQGVIYLRMYPNDAVGIKLLVLTVWLLDIGHTTVIWSALWSYLIQNYGDEGVIDIIHWNIAVTIVLTAVLTLLIHLFFAQRIFKLSKRNYWLTAPIVMLACLRLVSACGTTAEMIHLETFSHFVEQIRWIFTLGLALSTAVDILITASLFFLLQSKRSGLANLNAVIDSLIWYTFETSSLTTAGTIVAMICWLVMPSNLIFMGLHFVIAKFYANSFLVTLISRKKIRQGRRPSGSMEPVPVHLLDTRRPSNRTSDEDLGEQYEKEMAVRHSEQKAAKLQSTTEGQVEINVERSIQYD